MPRTLALVLFVLIMVTALLGAQAAFGAGAYSHWYIARAAGKALRNDPTAPADLVTALNDPDALLAFSCGAVSPDLSAVNMAAHHKNTMQIPTKLLKLAQRRMDAANALPDDDPEKSDRLYNAKCDLAFAYGWMSHVAADFVVHPIVNAVVGDAYEHVDLGGKALHAAQEVQLDYYVDHTLREQGDTITYEVPYDLLSAASGVSAASLKASAVVMNTKLAAGISWQNAVDVDMGTLDHRWKGVVGQIVSETNDYVSSPGKVKNWDLDIGGHMTTEDFETLRAQVLEANGGKLPRNWGSNYIYWFNKTRNLPPAKVKKILVALIHMKPKSTSNLPDFGRRIPVSSPDPRGSSTTRTHAAERHNAYGVKVKRTDTCGELKVWINGKEVPENSEFPSTGCSVLNFKVMCSDPRRFDWKKTFPPKDITVTRSTPYEFCYNWPDPHSDYQTRWTVSEEVFDWWTCSPTAGWTQEKIGFSSSGRYPTVKKDVFVWTIPMPEISSRKKESVYTVRVEGSMSYRVVDILPDGTEQRHSNATFGSQESAEFSIAVPCKR